MGTFVTIEGAQATYPLKLDSLEQWTNHKIRRPKWLLMSVQPATTAAPETAIVWVSDTYREKFLKLFEDYLEKSTPTGKRANEALVANISQIRVTILRDLWQSAGEPPQSGTAWWELWLAGQPDLSQVFTRLDQLGIHAADRATVFQNRTVMWVRAAWDNLQVLPFTDLALAEIRRPSFVDTIEDLTLDEQAEWVDELHSRVTPAGPLAPLVCHLDTGVARTHVLLADSLPPEKLYTVVGSTGFDADGHGTKMAGIALYGNLDRVLVSGQPVEMSHGLESVRILPSRQRGEILPDPLDYGTVTAQAIATAEIGATRRRVFCMPVTTDPDKPGDPTLWSATIDALCVGTDVVRENSEIRLIGQPDPDAARLVVISAGNTVLPDDAAHLVPLDVSDATGIADPAQSWNALTVGAYTDLVAESADPQFSGWEALVPAGELSPHSRTSVPFSRKWPIKPDICLEGGNVLTDGHQLAAPPHLSVRTTGIQNDRTITSANATSAATAAAARLAALVMDRYPDYWPETVRGLLVHAADWTPRMHSRLDDPSLSKTKRGALLRRYGWGVPTEDSVLRSSSQAVTMIVQDEFQPFDGPQHRMRHFRLHTLPWPKQVLEAVGEHDVSMKVTLSYFIEPNPSRRGWRQRYAYASHGLRFELKAPHETNDDFIRRVNKSAADEESSNQGGSAGMPTPSSGSERWLVGPKQRNTGSLHQDVWNGYGAALAPCDQIAVYPVGGWWKNNRRKDRADLNVRYALAVSLTTKQQDVDLYTPIASLIGIPTSVLISG